MSKLNVPRYLRGLLEAAVQDLDYNDLSTARGRIQAVIRIFESDNIEEEIWEVAADIEKLSEAGQ